MKSVQPHIVRRLSVFGLIAALTIIAGCSGEAKNSVKGSVTLDGKPVAGTVEFISADGKTLQGPLSDGKYTIPSPAKGSYKVVVKGDTGLLPGGGMAAPPKDAKMTEMPGKVGIQSVQPPKMYADPASSGLTFEVTGGRQVNDITLKPDK